MKHCNMLLNDRITGCALMRTLQRVLMRATPARRHHAECGVPHAHPELSMRRMCILNSGRPCSNGASCCTMHLHTTQSILAAWRQPLLLQSAAQNRRTTAPRARRGRTRHSPSPSAPPPPLSASASPAALDITRVTRTVAAAPTAYSTHFAPAAPPDAAASPASRPADPRKTYANVPEGERVRRPRTRRVSKAVAQAQS